MLRGKEKRTYSPKKEGDFPCPWPHNKARIAHVYPDDILKRNEAGLYSRLPIKGRPYDIGIIIPEEELIFHPEEREYVIGE